MGVNGSPHQEAQRPAAGVGGVDRVDFTWSGARRVTFALGIAGLVLVAGWSLAGLDRLVTRFPVDVSRRQNKALRAQQEAIREQAFELAGRVAETVEHGRWIARLTGAPPRVWEGQYPRLPARDAGDEAMIAWLSEQGTRLAAIGDELMSGRTDPLETTVKQASAPAPLIVGWVTVGGRPAGAMAETGSARRPGAAPSGR